MATYRSSATGECAATRIVHRQCRGELLGGGHDWRFVHHRIPAEIKGGRVNRHSMASVLQNNRAARTARRIPDSKITGAIVAPAKAWIAPARINNTGVR